MGSFLFFCRTTLGEVMSLGNLYMVLFSWVVYLFVCRTALGEVMSLGKSYMELFTWVVSCLSVVHHWVK
jgi:hypothetical protein